jgi:hypothetical protein
LPASGLLYDRWASTFTGGLEKMPVHIVTTNIRFDQETVNRTTLSPGYLPVSPPIALPILVDLFFYATRAVSEKCRLLDSRSCNSSREMNRTFSVCHEFTGQAPTPFFTDKWSIKGEEGMFIKQVARRDSNHFRIEICYAFQMTG